MSPAEVARLLGNSDQFVLDLCRSKELLYKAYGDRRSEEHTSELQSHLT
jgi:hypothetical protein